MEHGQEHAPGRAEEGTGARSPLLLEQERGERELVRRLRVPRDLAALEGHFPGAPLVAGVVQLGWVMEAARELLEADPVIVAFESLRFRDALAPEQELRLLVELTDARDVVRFRLDAGARSFLAGRVRLAGAGAP